MFRNVLFQESNSTLVLTHKGTRVRSGGMTQITNQHLLTIAPNIKDKSNIVYVLRPKKGERRFDALSFLQQINYFLCMKCCFPCNGSIY